MQNHIASNPVDKPSLYNQFVIFIASIKRDWKKHLLKAVILIIPYCISFYTNPNHGKLLVSTVMAVLLGVVIITMINIIIDNFYERGVLGKVLIHRFAFSIMSGAITQLKTTIFRTNQSQINNLQDMLLRIQKVVVMILKEYSIKDGYISVNYMKRDGNKLVIEEWDGAKTVDHIGIDLYVDINNPLCGAPSACVKKSVQYINNTESKSYREYFHNNRYKSFFSLPVLNSQQDVIGVINVDSDRKNQFKNKSFIIETIKPVIEPIVTLIEFNEWLQRWLK